MYLPIKNELLRSRFLKSSSITNRETDRCDRTHYHAAFARGKIHRGIKYKSNSFNTPCGHWSNLSLNSVILRYYKQLIIASAWV